jgi:hypothetical protein
LGKGQFGSLEGFAQEPDHAVGEGVEQESKLVGKEQVATETVGFEMVFEFLDPFSMSPR